MDINRLPEPAPQQPIQPLEWTWIVQRQETPDAKAASIWKFGFIAPDGGEVRVTFHQVGDNVKPLDHQKQQQQQQAAQSSAMMGMPPSGDPTDFAPPGQPNTDDTQGATFYVTFFSNRSPNSFMKWDTSLSHEDSLITWVTITHGIMDFVRKAQPANMILDDLSNGKMKMVLRSVAMDVVATNPEYSIEQTQKHHYRTLFQVKKAGIQSAFQNAVAGTGREGETNPPGPNQHPNEVNPQNVNKQQSDSDDIQQPPEQSNAGQTPGATGLGDKSGDHEPQQPEQGTDEMPAFPSHEPVPIKVMPPQKKGLTVEIGQDDYSVAVKDKDGNAVDRYRGKGPADILRWINSKGYAANKMKIVKREMPSYMAKPQIILARTPATDGMVKPVTGTALGVQEESKPEVKSDFVIEGTIIRMNKMVPAKQAALMNYIVNASQVKCTEETVEFVFETDRDMNFKRALVELAFNRTEDAKSAPITTSRAAAEIVNGSTQL